MNKNNKIKNIEYYFTQIMKELNLNLEDDSLKMTPKRVAKMYVNEIFNSLFIEEPKISTFINKYKYNQILIEKNITLYSTCEHHFLPIIGKAHVAYISNGVVIGLSKINRIVKYYAQRPQVQERLTIQIVDKLKSILKTNNVACVIDAQHLCVSSRGIQDINSNTITMHLSGKFESDPIKNDFLSYILK